MARVLIIEDEEKMARTLARVLGEEGHITETAHDGRTGLSRALEDSFDLLIVDWMLPERQGGKSLGSAGDLLRGEKTSFVYLDKRILSVIGLWHLQASELGRLLIGVSEDRQIEISGLKLEAARLLTPPIHPRVSSAVAVPSALLLISRAGRDGVARFA